MAAIQVTSANTNTQAQGARVCVRNSSGTPYVVLESSSAGASGIQVWKGNSTTPSSFSEQDNTNNPETGSTLEYGSCSAAIDSTDIIHIAYMYDNGKLSELRYVTFDADGTTDTFSGDAQVIADIGDDPGGIANLSTAITVDSSDIPHVAYTEWRTDMGTSWGTIKYNNRVGGAWNASGTEIEGVTVNKQCVRPDITIDSNNVPCISYHNFTDDHLGSAIDSSNDALSFTLHDILTTIDSTRSITSIAVDSNGDQWVGWNHNLGEKVRIIKHTKASAWTTGWSSEFEITADGTISTITINGTDVYVFYQDTEADQRIAYDKYTGSWAGETILETPPASEDFVEAKAKWSWHNNFGSNGTDYGGVRSATTYYFDGSDAAATDPDVVWTNETNADDGSTATDATSITAGTATTNEIKIEGTNAPASGGNISLVKARIYGGHSGLQEWGAWQNLSIPSGGWTWAKIQALEVGIFGTNGTVITEAAIYTDGFGALLGTATVGANTDDFLVSRVEISVESWTITTGIPELDYTFRNSTDNDIYWNTLSIAVAGAGVLRRPIDNFIRNLITR
jgi:hypothetical protein